MTVGPGGWDDASLLSTAQENPGLGTDEGMPDPIRFLVNVTKLIRRRLAQEATSETAPAIFFLLPGGPGVSDLKREPLLHNGRVELGGCFWFLSPLVTNAHGLAHPDWDDAVAFERAEVELDVGDCVAIVFDPRPPTPELHFYPEGLASDIVKTVLLDASNVTLDDVLAVVDTVHQSFLITPGPQQSWGKLWQNKAKFYPVKNAEAVIQLYLRIGIQTAFPSCIVREELHGVAGRLDLEIEEPYQNVPGASVPKAVLELKVLRAYGSTGISVSPSDIDEWIEDGVRQVASYRNERKARESALCCFDMRKQDSGEACFSHVVELAESLRVRMRVWFLYNAAKALQKAQTTEWASAES